jgi:hypothetical protein
MARGRVHEEANEKKKEEEEEEEREKKGSGTKQNSQSGSWIDSFEERRTRPSESLFVEALTWECRFLITSPPAV